MQHGNSPLIWNTYHCYQLKLLFSSLFAVSPPEFIFIYLLDIIRYSAVSAPYNVTLY